MPDDYQQSPRIKKVKRDAIYNFYEASPNQPPPIQPQSSRPGRWGWLSGIGAALVLAGTVTTTQFSARTPVYYCASRNTVKYHADATCSHLQQCSARVKSMPLGQAKDKMEPCKGCH